MENKMIMSQKRLNALFRRFKFETIKSLGIFYLIEKTTFLKIKQPWDKLYQRRKNR